MNKLDNPQATKEFELAQQIQSGINSFCFSPEAKEMMGLRTAENSLKAKTVRPC
jgi:hypothetical protein